MISFKGRQCEKDIILQCVRWYVAYALSHRDLEEMMRERSIPVDHSTIQGWVVKSSPLLEPEFKKHKDFVANFQKLFNDSSYQLMLRTKLLKNGLLVIS